jgi:hypothetical protein
MIFNTRIHDQSSRSATIPMDRPRLLRFDFPLSIFFFLFSVIPTPSPVLPLPTSLRYTQPMSILRRL